MKNGELPPMGWAGVFQKAGVCWRLRPVSYVHLVFYLFLLPLFVGCLNLSVYGPHDDFSGLPNDFISESIKKNLRIGQPYGDKEMIKDASARFATIGFDLQLIEKYLESANAVCTREKDELKCEAVRSWSIIWPKPTTDLDGVLRTERIQQVNLQLSYIIRENGSRTPTVSINLKYNQ